MITKRQALIEAAFQRSDELSPSSAETGLREAVASTLAMLGWQDSDGDGIFDVLDVPHRLTGSGYMPQGFQVAAGWPVWWAWRPVAWQG